MVKPNTYTIRPGLLVGLKTSVTGGVSYRRVDIEREHVTARGTAKAKWETTRVVEDPTEHAAAITLNNACRYIVQRVCAKTDFGLLCPEEKADELYAAIEEAQAKIAEFNKTAKLTRIGMYVVPGRVARDDEQAVRAIRAEVSGLIAEMQRGVRELNPEAVRAAAKQAKQIGNMLSEGAQQRLLAAVDSARSIANVINSAVKAGEQSALDIDKEKITALEAARTAFLDIEDMKTVVNIPNVPVRGLDLVSPEAPSRKRSAPETKRDIEV